MPRVHQKKSQGRAEGGVMTCCQCVNPIVKGDEYYEWSLKRQRGGVTYRQHTSHGPVKSSQLTESKMSDAYAAIEGAESDIASAESTEDVESALNDCAQAIRDVADQYQESFDNIPENLQQGGPAQEITEKVDALNEFADELESAASSLDDDTPDEENPDAQAEALEANRSAAEEALGQFSL